MSMVALDREEENCCAHLGVGMESEAIGPCGVYDVACTKKNCNNLTFNLDNITKRLL